MADAPTSGIGARTLRLEDPTLLRGAEYYTADLDIDGVLQAVFVRAQLAHARITGVDTRAASAQPGVVAVFTSADLDTPQVFYPAYGELIKNDYHRVPLASDVVRFVGEVIAVVVAETTAQAQDAAEFVVVDYDPLPAVVDPVAAAAADAPLLFPATGTNVAFAESFEAGVRTPGSPVRVTTSLAHPRIAVAPMEPLAIVAVPEPDGMLTLWNSNQMPHALRDLTASFLGRPPETLRAVCPAVGGGFGGKTPAEPDYVLVAVIAERLGRPVRWIQTRSENLLTMQARGVLFDVTLEATRDGRVTGVAVSELADVGAYPGIGIGMTMTSRGLATGAYDIPHGRFDIRCVATNTAPVGSFRGAGRPEAIHMLERSMDVLAAELDLDPVELRRRNFIRPEQRPYVNIMGETYDSVDFEKALDEALRVAGYEQLRAEQQRRRASGDPRLLGIGISVYVEVSAGMHGLDEDYASVEVDEDGSVTVVVGTSAHGQGHWTTFAQIVSSAMGVDPEVVEFVQSDTDTVKRGKGTGGSRSAQIGGSAVRQACDAVIAQAKELAAHLLEATVDDLEVMPGAGIGVKGVPASAISWAGLAKEITRAESRPTDLAPRLFADPGFNQDGGTSPFGCHIAVVEVDRETGLVELSRMIAVDDCGTVINPMLAEGQVHGGLAAGIGQVLYEVCRYDAAGNPTTTTFADYAMPSAAELPSYETAHTVTPTTKNPLGAKGLGEAGTTGSIAAVHNAVLDALRPLGVTHLDIPLTPLAVWTAITASG